MNRWQIQTCCLSAVCNLISACAPGSVNAAPRNSQLNLWAFSTSTETRLSTVQNSQRTMNPTNLEQSVVAGLESAINATFQDRFDLVTSLTVTHSRNQVHCRAFRVNNSLASLSSTHRCSVPCIGTTGLALGLPGASSIKTTGMRRIGTRRRVDTPSAPLHELDSRIKQYS